MTISTIPLNQFYPQVKYLARGALDVAVQEAVLRSLQALCKRGWAWEEDAEDVDLVANISDYDLDVRPDTYVTDLFVFYRGRRLGVLSPRELAQRESDNGIPVGTPHGYLRLANASIRLDRVPAADESNGLKAVAFLMPTEFCVEVPEEFWHEWREGVIAGALAQLKAQPDKPWSDPASVEGYRRTHESTIEASRIRVLRKYSDSQLRATGRRII